MDMAVIDEIYVFPRQDGWFDEIERGWNVSLVSLNGTELMTYDWEPGQGFFPFVWRRATWPSPPPPLTPSPPAVQAQNTPCEGHALPCSAAGPCFTVHTSCSGAPGVDTAAGSQLYCMWLPRRHSALQCHLLLRLQHHRILLHLSVHCPQLAQRPGGLRAVRRQPGNVRVVRGAVHGEPAAGVMRRLWPLPWSQLALPSQAPVHAAEAAAPQQPAALGSAGCWGGEPSGCCWISCCMRLRCQCMAEGLTPPNHLPWNQMEAYFQNKGILGIGE